MYNEMVNQILKRKPIQISIAVLCFTIIMSLFTSYGASQEKDNVIKLGMLMLSLWIPTIGLFYFGVVCIMEKIQMKFEYLHSELKKIQDENNKIKV